jgi:hypothetical protein
MSFFVSPINRDDEESQRPFAIAEGDNELPDSEGIHYKNLRRPR